MHDLTEDAVHNIEQIHARWIAMEIEGDAAARLTFCAEEIEFRPPDGKPVIGRSAVAETLTAGGHRIHTIDIANRRIRGSGQFAYLTADYRTTFSSAEDPTPKQASGSHLWILQRRGGMWLVTLVTWSSWNPS